MLKISNKETRTTDDTALYGMVNTILREEVPYYSGEVETLQANIGTLTKMMQFMLEQMPEAMQAEFVNKFSYKFEAEVIEG